MSFSSKDSNDDVRSSSSCSTGGGGGGGGGGRGGGRTFGPLGPSIYPRLGPLRSKMAPNP